MHAKQSILIDDQRFYIEKMHIYQKNYYILHDEKNHVFNITKDNESNKIYLNNELIGEFTNKYKPNEEEELQRRVFMKAAGTGWSAWANHDYVDGNVKVNMTAIATTISVICAITGCIAANISGELGNYLSHFADKAYYRQWEQIYSKYGTQVHYATQFYKDQANKHPVGKKIYSNPIFKE